MEKHWQFFLFLIFFFLVYRYNLKTTEMGVTAVSYTHLTLPTKA